MISMRSLAVETDAAWVLKQWEARAAQGDPLACDIMAFRDAADQYGARLTLKSLSEAPDLLPPLVRLASRLEPRLRRAFLAAAQKAKNQANLQRLAEAIAAGQLSQAEAYSGSLSLAEGFREPLRMNLVAGFLSGAGYGIEELRTFGAVLQFNLMNPHAANYAKQMSVKLVDDVKKNAGESVRALIAEAVEFGVTPAKTALIIRDANIVGLHPRQTAAFAKYWGKLQAEGVKEEIMDRRLQRYGNALLRQRSLTIARTEIMRSTNSGQLAAWQDARRQGLIYPDAQRRWRGTNDDRTDLEVCFTGGTSILTITGWKPIRDVQVGEYVLTHQDRFRKVTQRMARHHNGAVVRINLSSREGFKVTATANHPFLTQRGWIRADELTGEDFLVASAKPCVECGALIPYGPANVNMMCRACSVPIRNQVRWRDPAQHAKLTEQNLMRWNQPGAREQQAEKMRGDRNPTKRPEIREKIRAAALLQMHPRTKPVLPRRTLQEWGASPDHHFRHPSLQHRQQSSARLKAWMASLSDEQRTKLWRNAVTASGRTSRGGSYPEKKMAQFLCDQNLLHDVQWPFFYYDGDTRHRGYADFYLPGPNIVIECDGSYHRNPEIQRRDVLKTQTLIEQGVTVLRFPGSQIVSRFHEVASAVRAHCCMTLVKPRLIRHAVIHHQPVYNLAVEEDQSYVAGGYVVHNCLPLDGEETGLNEPFVVPDGDAKGESYDNPPAHPSSDPKTTPL